jgi:hypothetical protein
LGRDEHGERSHGGGRFGRDVDGVGGGPACVELPARLASLLSHSCAGQGGEGRGDAAGKVRERSGVAAGGIISRSSAGPRAFGTPQPGV